MNKDDPTLEQIEKIKEIFSRDIAIKKFKESKDQLHKEKQDLDLDLESINMQFKSINVEQQINSNITIKGVPISSEVFLEKKERLDKLRNWVFRLRKAREHKSIRALEIKKQLEEINIAIKHRKSEIHNSVLKECGEGNQ